MKHYSRNEFDSEKNMQYLEQSNTRHDGPRVITERDKNDHWIFYIYPEGKDLQNDNGDHYWLWVGGNNIRTSQMKSAVKVDFDYFWNEALKPDKNYRDRWVRYIYADAQKEY